MRGILLLLLKNCFQVSKNKTIDLKLEYYNLDKRLAETSSRINISDWPPSSGFDRHMSLYLKLTQLAQISEQLNVRRTNLCQYVISYHTKEKVLKSL